MSAEEIKKSIYNNNIGVGCFLTFNTDPNRYTLENFKKEDKVLVNDIESGDQRLKKIEDIVTANNKAVQFPNNKGDKKLSNGNVSNGFVIYQKGSEIYALSLDYEKNGRVYFKSTPAYKITIKRGEGFNFAPIKNPPSSYNVHMLPGFKIKEKETHGQLELPGMERRAAKGGFPVLYNATKNIKTLQELVDNPEFYNWFMKNSNLQESTDVRKFIRESIENLYEEGAYEYTAVDIVDEESFENKFESILVEMGLYDKYLSYRHSPDDYHMTVSYGRKLDGARRLRDIGKSTTLNIKGVGFSGAAMALRVEGDYMSRNENQHITIAFNTDAKSSNDIEWNNEFPIRYAVKYTSEEPGYYSFDEPFSVVGEIKEKFKDEINEAEKNHHFDDRKKDGIGDITKIGVSSGAFVSREDRMEIIKIAIEQIKDQLYAKINSLEGAEFNRGKIIAILLGCVKVISNGQEFTVRLFNRRGKSGSCYYATADRNQLITLILYDGHYGQLDKKKDGVFNLKRIALSHFKKKLASGRENRNLYFPDDRNKYKYVSQQGNSITVKNINTGEESVKDFRQMGNLDTDLYNFSENVVVDFDKIREERGSLNEAAKHFHYGDRIKDRVDGIIDIKTGVKLSEEEKERAIQEIKENLKSKAYSLMNHEFPNATNVAVHLGCVKVKKDGAFYNVYITTKGSKEDKERIGMCYYVIVESGTLLILILYDQGDMKLDRQEMIKMATNHSNLKNGQSGNVEAEMKFSNPIIIDLDKRKSFSDSVVNMKKDKPFSVKLEDLKKSGFKFKHPKLGAVEVLQYMGLGEKKNTAKIAAILDGEKRTFVQVPYR